MALSVNGILFDELTADPGAPAEGQLWYNTTDKLFKVYRNGAITSLTDKAAFDGHANSTSNPHSTTLEQARTANATLAGNIAMGTNIITGLGAGSAATDAAQRGWVTDQINAKVHGMDWQDPVINSQTTPPVPTPTTGDRYRITATAGGVWAGKENQIAQWNGTGWDYTVPVEGFVLRDLTANTYLAFDGAVWGNFGATIDHSQLINLISGDPHTQYQQESERNQINGYCGLGADATIGDTRHGNRSGGTLHATVSSSGAGFLPQSKLNATVNPGVNDDGTAGYIPGSRWLNLTAMTEWVMISNGTGAAVWKETTNAASVLPHKAGIVAAGSFAGNPKKATVTFTTPFSDANYAVTCTAVTSNGKTYAPNAESQLAGSFVIHMGSNSITDLVQVNWHATKNGEST